MILSDLSRLLIVHNRKTSHRIMSVSRKGYRLWANCGIPIQPFEMQQTQHKLGKNQFLPKNLFKKTEHRCVHTQPDACKIYFKLIKEKEVKEISWQWIFGLLKLKIIDKDFSYREFVKNSHEALCIVCDKIAEEEYSALNELLTPECLSEVQDNFSKLEPEKKRLFPLEKGAKSKYLLSQINIDSNSSSEGSQSEEKIVTILLISASITPTEAVPGQDGNHLYKHYHAEFKRSYRNNFKSHWVISDMNMKSKTSQYGIKVWILCDSKSSYAFRAQICTGKLPEEMSETDQGIKVVSRLTQGLKYRNITYDNFFTSYRLGQFLLKRKLTMLGPIKSCRSELPALDAIKELPSSVFYFTSDTTFVHYIPQKSKPVFLLSTMHKRGELSDRDDKTPVMNMEYESTKGAVDRLEREIATYSCKRKTKLWTTTLFYHIIDISAYNAFILWTGINPTWKRNKLYKIRMFLEELGTSLVLPYMVARKNFPRTEEALSILKNVQDKSVASSSSSCAVTERAGGHKRARCKFCPKTCNNKTSTKCASCGKYLCKTHTVYLCLECKK